MDFFSETLSGHSRPLLKLPSVVRLAVDTTDNEDELEECEAEDELSKDGDFDGGMLFLLFTRLSLSMSYREGGSALLHM